MLLDILPVLLVIYIIFLAPGRYHEVLNPANSLHTGNNNVMALNIVLDGLHHLTILVEVELYALLTPYIWTIRSYGQDNRLVFF